MKVGVRKRHIFNLFGVIIIVLWITMLSLLVKKHYFSQDSLSGIESQAETGEKRRSWKEIYLKDKKVGYSVNSINPFENGYYIQDELYLRLNLMGFEKGLYTITQSSVDSNFRLKNFFFKMNSGVINYRIRGKVEGNILKIQTGTGRRAKTTELRMPEIPIISSSVDQLFRKVKLIPGESFRLSFFDPSTMTQKSAVFNLKNREKIKINYMEYDAVRIESEMWGNKLIFWVDEDGDILKEEGFMGLTMVKSSAANAPANLAEGVDDFYEITSVGTDKKLPDPGRLTMLKLRLEGIDETEFDRSGLSNERQDFSSNIITVKKEREPFKIIYNIPYSGDDAELKKYLEPEFNIQSDDSEIIQKALKIAGKVRSPVAVSKKMMAWVYSSLEKQPVVSIPSAVEVLEARSGDCNEHATLLTALLRAAGIPARISVGLVYIRERFFYHAWVEAYTGQWITLDPTLNQMPADVTHISLLRGNIDKQVEIMALIGKLKIEVMDFEYY
ncbi:MAG: transglutaminase domain-containing protein [Desulfobacteraceae bacterium]|jgi:hypothetical protein